METYPGSAVSIWNNFDREFIYNLIDHTIKLRKNDSVEENDAGGIKLNYDNPADIENDFNRIMTESKLKQLELLKLRKNK